MDGAEKAEVFFAGRGCAQYGEDGDRFNPAPRVENNTRARRVFPCRLLSLHFFYILRFTRSRRKFRTPPPSPVDRSSFCARARACVCVYTRPHKHNDVHVWRDTSAGNDACDTGGRRCASGVARRTTAVAEVFTRRGSLESFYDIRLRARRHRVPVYVRRDQFAKSGAGSARKTEPDSRRRRRVMRFINYHRDKCEIIFHITRTLDVFST